MILQELYQDIMMDHVKQPRNFGLLEKANHSQTGHNPLCGDQLTLFILVSNHVVTDLRFSGKGCAISMASASLMTETVKGKTTLEIQAIFDAFHQLATTGILQNEGIHMGQLLIFSNIVSFPMRVKCATLAWHTLKSALRQQSQAVVTTE